MSKFFGEFKKFILRGNVVDLAIGIIIGAAFGKIVESMVADVFMPIIGLITGGVDVSGMGIEYRDARINTGKFLQAIINFTIIGFCMFLVVKGMNAMHARFSDAEAVKTVEPSSSEKLLIEIRDLLKSRQS